MKAGRAWIGIYQKMRIKNLRGSVRFDLKKLDSFTLETSKRHLNFLRNGRVRLKRILSLKNLNQLNNILLQYFDR